MIATCTCKHTAQDELHGAGQRVFNWARKAGGSDTGAWRCTVCKALKHAPAPANATPDKKKSAVRRTR